MVEIEKKPPYMGQKGYGKKKARRPKLDRLAKTLELLD
jgi:hypothetical protein